MNYLLHTWATIQNLQKFFEDSRDSNVNKSIEIVGRKVRIKEGKLFIQYSIYFLFIRK